MAGSVFLNAALAAVVVLGLAVLFHPRVRNAELWRATVTPLASIIGSGFLIIGPILVQRWGRAAPIAMLVLCAAAYAVGHVIRFNIRHLEPALEDGSLSKPTHVMERASSWALGGAYITSVTYYLNLFGSFFVEEVTGRNPILAKAICTAVFVFIAVFGAWRGLGALEKLEVGAVGIKLSIIAAMLVGMIVRTVHLAATDALPTSSPTPGTLADQAMMLGGLLVTVQGFETSRYLGEEHGADTRVRTMRWAQWGATGIYVLYTALVGLATRAGSIEVGDETAIIEISRDVATLLPHLLVVAALASQLSAAVADTNGGGGLFEEVSHRRLKARWAYVGMAVLGIALTWLTDVFEIIALASRAFALYYALQCIAAASVARHAKVTHRELRIVAYLAIATLCLLACVFGQPAE